MHGTRPEHPDVFVARMQMHKQNKQTKQAGETTPPARQSDTDQHRPATAPAKRVLPLTRKSG